MNLHGVTAEDVVAGEAVGVEEVLTAMDLVAVVEVVLVVQRRGVLTLENCIT